MRRGRPSTAHGKRRSDAVAPDFPRAVSRREDRVGAGMQHDILSAKKSMNTCPICKMPLYIDDAHESDRLWRQTQHWFKGKPSFTLDDVGPRNRNTFGPVHGLGKRDPDKNANGCHFVHVSASEGMTTFNGMWDMFVDPQGIEQTFQLCVFLNERPIKDRGFCDRLNITYSMFSELEPMHQDHAADPFIWPECRFNSAQINRTTAIISTGTFTACWDCNEKMTQMKLIPMFFGHSFQHRHDIGEDFIHTEDMELVRRRELLLNAQIYYILMQAMLKYDNVIDPATRAIRVANGMQHVTIFPDQQLKWKFKLVILWSLLMILLSNWNATELSYTVAHHALYIYAGTSDFYVSLIMYMTYITNYTGAGNPLSFEEFHYYYITNFVFYLKRKRILVDDPATTNNSNSLTAAIMNPAACTTPRWGSLNLGLGMRQSDTPANFLTRARQDIAVLYRGITKFSNMYLKPLCMHLYNPAMLDQPYEDYFPSLATVQARGRFVSTIQRDSIQAYVDHLGPEMYWYHFKNITMPQISNAVRIARDMGTEEAKRVIDLWYKHASSSARHLRGPMPTSEDRALVRLSAQFAAALRLRASSGAPSSCRS